MSPGRRNPAGRVGRRQQLLSPHGMSAQGAVHGENKLVFVLVVGIGFFCLSLLRGANWHEKGMQGLWSWACVEVPSSSLLAQGEVVAVGSSPRPCMLPDRDIHRGKRSSLTRPPFPFLHSLRMLFIAVGQQMDLCWFFCPILYLKCFQRSLQPIVSQPWL